MESVTLHATQRAEFGKGAARKLRSAGQLPVVVYSAGKPATHLSVDPAALETIFRVSQNRNTLLSVDTGTGTAICLVKDVQRHPLKQTIQHLDLYEVDPGSTVDVLVPVRSTGTAAGVKMGGRLRPLIRDITVRCKPADIPVAVIYDVAELGVGRFIKASEALPIDGVELVLKSDMNAFTVVGKRGASA
ncbi:MAG: 50S ribosomal protein L25 [Myxococcota bacterium]|nr:50S ribosomal protein L25 [Myxococcota bacterium]